MQSNSDNSLSNLLKNLPQLGCSLNRNLCLVHLLYSKYKPLKDEITNKQIEFLIANDGILDKDLEPNPEFYLKEYNMIGQQVQSALALTEESILAIDHTLILLEQALASIRKKNESEGDSEASEQDSQDDLSQDNNEDEETDQVRETSKGSYCESVKEIN